MEKIPTQIPKFTLEKFQIEPKTDYDNLISRTNESSNVTEEFHNDRWELATDHISDCVDAIAGKHRTGTYREELDIEMSTRSENARAFLKERLAGKILIDLGGGESRSMESLAQMLGALAYIKVDVYFQSSLADKYGRLANNGKLEANGEMEVYHVKSDMLKFLSTIPDNSVCVTINGIDMSVIHSEEYHKALASEIMRVLIPDGIIFGRLSDSLDLIRGSLGVSLKLETASIPVIPSIHVLNFPNKFDDFYLDSLIMLGKDKK